MTRLLLKLHRTLWWRNVKTNPSIMMIAVVIILYTLAGLLAIIGTFSYATIDHQDWYALAGACALGTGAFAIAAIVFPNGENQISPAQLASQPVTTKDVLPAMGWASVFTSRGIAAILSTTVTMIATVWLFTAQGKTAAAIVSIPMLLLAFVTTLLLGELVTSANRGTTRKSQELSNVLSMVVGIAAIFGYTQITSSFGTLPLESIGKYAAWTPLAAAPGALGSAMYGHWLAAILQLLIAVVTVVAGAWLWHRLTVRELVAPLDRRGAEDPKKKKKQHTGEFPLLMPGLKYGQGTMIYSRALRYLRRDSRLLGNLIILPLFAIGLIAQSFFFEPSVTLPGALFLAVFVAMISSNDLGFDGPGNAAQILAGVSGRTWIVARHLASITVSWVVLILYCVAMISLYDDKLVATLFALGSFGMALGSGAIAVLFSAFNPFPTSPPGTNPWADKSGNSAGAYLSAFGALLTCWIPAAPGAGLMANGYFSGQTWVMWLGAVVVIVIPLAVYVGVFALASRRISNNMPEIYAKVGHWVT
ncbi:hypothetical protein QP027_06940 [Corynebacterium breve]|uniref:ABC transporter permease n=1 Tax=Corynebacterium breve TaxID=3049799 RepID=A0ABY8VB32_9CORY|nr:hypothetical protein [Corynebacterium breve]WIM66870.1 hypothetical protein QP027_06940 [Corynebacterium breve]